MKKKNNELEGTIAEIRDKFGAGSIMMFGDKPIADVESVSTGSIGLDAALGVGGLPIGRITEIYGPEGSGKTTLALHVVAEAQKKGGACAFVDVEHALDPKYSAKIGVDLKSLLLSQPDSGEEALQITESLIKSKNIAVVVIDSVAAIIPRDELNGEIGDRTIATRARLMSQALCKLTPLISKSGTVVIFTNQIRIDVGAWSPNGKPVEITSGGKALKFFASVRLSIRRLMSIKKGDEVVGNRVRAKIIKNKVAAPFKEAEFDIIYDEGISPTGELLTLGEKYRLVSKAGAFYSYGEIKLGRGYDASRKFLKENEEVREDLTSKIREKIA